MESFGADGGAYANKPATLNGVSIGMLPTSSETWETRAMALPKAAIEALGFTNTVTIDNSTPQDAFKVRKNSHNRLGATSPELGFCGGERGWPYSFLSAWSHYLSQKL